MKPRISLSKGLPGYFPSTWWCTGAGFIGVGSTPALAYESWVVSANAARNVTPGQWIQQPPPKPLNRFQRWILQCGDWR